MRKKIGSGKEILSCLEISSQYVSQKEQPEMSKIICDEQTDNNLYL